MLKTEDGMILRDNVFGTPEQDALRRDFTVNALFYNIADYSVIDYVGGMEDLRAGLIRIIGDPVVRFTEDPVRMVRAVRFAANLGLEIEEQTLKALLELKDRVALASPSRMYEEVLKLFMLGQGEKTYQLLRKTGMFGVIFPGLNEWVDTESDGFPHIWIGKALEWIDACVQAGRQPQPHIMFGLLFGQYIEEKARQLRESGAASPRCHDAGRFGDHDRPGAARADPQEDQPDHARYVLEPAAVRAAGREVSALFPSQAGVRRGLRVPSLHERDHGREEGTPRLVEGLYPEEPPYRRRGTNSSEGPGEARPPAKKAQARRERQKARRPGAQSVKAFFATNLYPARSLRMRKRRVRDANGRQ